MKKLLVSAIVFCLVTACSGKYVVEEDQCDGIVNRPGESVCGKDRVRKNCQPYGSSNGKTANTCEKL